MPSVKLKGVNRVSKRLAGGERVTYWYAWKGGPRLEGEPGSEAFVASYAAAHAARKKPVSQGTLAVLVAKYRASPEFTRNAESTQAEWRRWLDRIEQADIGSLPYAALEEIDSRAILLDWRDTYADRPRTADYGAQVLTRVLAWSKGRGLIRAHHFDGVERLHEADRADQVWGEDDLTRFCAAASPEVGKALRLACLTGLRRGDLVALTWEQVGETAIVLAPKKSRRRKRVVATIPLLAETRELLGKRGKGVVLRNSRGEAWTEDGLESRIWTFKKAAKIAGLRLHDARGTFATRLRRAGLTRDEIAAVMGWEVDRVERLLARYVDNEAIVRNIADKLSRNRR